MNIVVIGGTGLIGSKTVAILRQGGHEVVAASPKSAINTITGEGHVVVDSINGHPPAGEALLEAMFCSLVAIPAGEFLRRTELAESFAKKRAETPFRPLAGDALSIYSRRAFPSALEAAMPPRNFINWVARIMV